MGIRLGIVLPTNGKSGRLSELIESLLGQSDARWNCLVVDDSGSGVVTRHLRQRSIPNDRIMVYSNRRQLGVPEAWNHGLKVLRSHGTYPLVAIVHHDDKLHRHYVRDTLQAFERFPTADVYHFRTRVIGNSGFRSASPVDLLKALYASRFLLRYHRSVGDHGLAEILRVNFVFCPSMVFNMTRVNEIAFDTRWRMVSDLDLIARLLVDGKELLRIPKTRYLYRRHSGSLTAKLTDSTVRFNEEIELYDELEAVCRLRGMRRSAAAARRKWSIRAHLRFRMLLKLLSLDRQGLQQLRLCLARCNP